MANIETKTTLASPINKIKLIQKKNPNFLFTTEDFRMS